MTTQIAHHNALTPAERQCLDWLFSGITSNKAMAREAKLTEYAIRSRMHNLLFKLNLPYGANRTDAMAAAINQGLIEITRHSQKVVGIAMLGLSLLMGCGFYSDDVMRAVRTRPARSQITRARGGKRHTPLDFIDMVLDDLNEMLRLKGNV